MPLYTFSGSQTFTARAYALQPDDELDVTTGATMTGQYEDGALITATGATIHNNGTISNERTVIEMQSGATLVNYGSISVGPPLNAYSTDGAVVVQSDSSSASNYIFNQGTIDGSGGPAISAYGNVAILNTSKLASGSNGHGVVYAAGGVMVQLTNDGTIDGGGTRLNPGPAIMAEGAAVLNDGAIYGNVSIGSGNLSNLGAIYGSVTAHELANYGSISSHDPLRPNTFVQGTDGDDSLINGGSVFGTISLGNGADSMTNLHGTISGTVDLGSGNDAYNATDGIVTGRIIGGAGDDTIFGGSGTDVIFGDNPSGDTSGGADTLSGGGGSDVIWGGYGADRIVGNQGDDVLSGNQDNDWIHGGQGNDQIWGGQGDDTINGGVGDDMLYGNLGNDLFVFSANFGHDTVADFTTTAGNSDTIRFEAGTFANYADVQAHMAQQGSDVVITLDAVDSIHLLNTTTAALTADHFLFG